MAHVIRLNKFSNRYYVQARLVIDNLPLNPVIEFLVDTGATHSFVRERDVICCIDAAKANNQPFKINMNHCVDDRVTALTGKAKVRKLARDDMELEFGDLNGHFVREKLPELIFPPKRQVSNRSDSSTSWTVTPEELQWSILGNDVMDNFSLLTFPCVDDAFLVKLDGPEGPDFVRDHLDVAGSPLHHAFRGKKGGFRWLPPGKK